MQAVRRIYFFKIGGFSRVNQTISRELAAHFPEYEFRIVDVEKEIVASGGGFFYLRALIETFIRYGPRLLQFPPRDFFPRLPCVLRAIRRWVARNVRPAHTAFIFQTQSLFDARREGVPHFIYTDHTYLANLRYEQPRRLLPVATEWRRMEKNLYHKATLNFTFSQFAADSILEDYGVQPAQVQCVHSGPNIDLPLSINTSRRTGQRILFMGVDWERKGGPDLVRAFFLVRQNFPDAELIVVGCEPEVSYQGMTIVGRISLAGVKVYYEIADIFCLPSHVDPSASVLLEASAYALPIVATAVGGNKERIIENETGFLVAPGDIISLADRLCRLLREPNLRFAMGNRGRQRVLDLFHWSRVMDRIASAIRGKIYSKPPIK